MEPHLRGLLEARSLRWVFVGGKGGVGKTTCSCSLAVQLAQVRESVLIISTDPAHNLSDAFRQRFGRHPQKVDGFSNLYALEVDPTPERDVDAGAAEGQESFLTELASSIPGIDEAMSFAEVLRLVQTMSFDCVVFDTAPTGHTLRLLQLPATLEKSLGKLLSLQSGLGGLFSTLTSMMGGGADVSEENMFVKLQGLKRMVEEVNAQFRDPTLTTFVCVACAEFLSLYETERLVQELARNDVDVHNVIINQVLFPEAGNGSRLLAARVRMQQRYLSQFHDLYEDFHVLELPLLAEEVRGADALREFSELLVCSPEERQMRAAKDEQGAAAGADAELAQLREENTKLRAALAAAGGKLPAA